MRKYLKLCLFKKIILFVFLLSFSLLANSRITQSGFDSHILNDNTVKEYLKNSKYKGYEIEDYFIEFKNKCEYTIKKGKESGKIKIDINNNFCTCLGNEVISYWLEKNEFLIYKTIISHYLTDITNSNSHIQTIINNHPDTSDQEWKDFVSLEEIKFQESCLQTTSGE